MITTHPLMNGSPKAHGVDATGMTSQGAATVAGMLDGYDFVTEFDRQRYAVIFNDHAAAVHRR